MTYLRSFCGQKHFMKPMKRDLDNFICQLCRYRMVTCRFISHLSVSYLIHSSWNIKLINAFYLNPVLFLFSSFKIIIAFCARKDFEHFLAVIYELVRTSVLLTLVENKLNMLNHTCRHVFTVLAQTCCNSVVQHYFN